MADGDLNALLAEREQAEADLAAIKRQIEAADKNIAEKNDFGVSDLKQLLFRKADLSTRIRDLTREIVALTPEPGMMYEGAPGAPPLPSGGPDPHPSTAPVPPDPHAGEHQPPVGDLAEGAFEVASDEAPVAPAAPAAPLDGQVLQPVDTYVPAGPVEEKVPFHEWDASDLPVGFEKDSQPAGNGQRVALIFGLIVLTLVGGGVGLAVLGSQPPPIALASPTASSTAPTATATPTTPSVTETIAPTLPVVTGPISYASECNGECFMEVDPVTCDRTFHFVLAIDEAYAPALEGKTAIISTKGPGLQPTYEVPVVGGKVTFDAVAKGADYGGNPNALCGANASWTGLLTSVDGIPTFTPDAPT